MKWDGVRAVVYVDGGRRTSAVAATTTTSPPPTPSCVSWRDRWARDRCVLDGEIVALDARGPAELRAAAAADARHEPDAGPAAGRDDAGDVPGLRPAPPRRAVAARAALRRAARGCSSRCSLAGPLVADTAGVVGDGADGAGGGPRARPRGRRRQAAATRATCPAGAAEDWLKVKNSAPRRWSSAAGSPATGRRAGTIGALLLGVPADDGARATSARSAPASPTRRWRDLAATLRGPRATTSPFAGRCRVPMPATRTGSSPSSSARCASPSGPGTGGCGTRPGADCVPTRPPQDVVRES